MSHEACFLVYKFCPLNTLPADMFFHQSQGFDSNAPDYYATQEASLYTMQHT